MNKIIAIVLAIIAIVGVFFFKNNDKTIDGVLGEDIRLTAYTINGEKNSNGALGINFLKSTQDRSKLSLAIDTNQDGLFQDEEWVIKDVSVLPKENKRNNVYFTAPESFDSSMKVNVILNDESIIKDVSIQTIEVGDWLGLENIKNPEEAMKGISIAQAEDGIIEITQDEVPDINQRKGECAPTSAANGLISLINKHGSEDDKIQNPRDLIEELKDLMNWDIEDGVIPDNFVEGKNLWAAKHGLPIRTTKVGDKNGISTIEEIKDALENGDAVELRIAFANADGKGVGGHMVTVTGIHQGEGQTYIDINDPYTDSEQGTETVEIRSNQITNYGPWQGLTVLSWGFVQTWETPLNSGTALDEMTDGEISGIRESVGQTRTVSMETSFVHVKPGEYSEIYASVLTTAGEEVNLNLDGPGVVGQKRQIVVAGADGIARFTWRINLYGNYTVSGGENKSLKSTIIVN